MVSTWTGFCLAEIKGARHAHRRPPRPRGRTGREDARQLPERVGRLSTSAHCAARGGDRVAPPHRALLRALPPGGEVAKDYRFDGPEGAVGLADLFDGKDTLVVYNFMFGPDRRGACPMCASTMSAWDGAAPHIQRRVAFAMVARSPMARIQEHAAERGWRNLRLYSDPTGEYTRDYVSAEDGDAAGYTV